MTKPAEGMSREEIEAVWEIVYRRYVDTTPNVYYAMVQRMRAPFDLALSALTQQAPGKSLTQERIDELWKQAMSASAEHFVSFLHRGLVPNFSHPENLTLPQRFAILLLAEDQAPGKAAECGHTFDGKAIRPCPICDTPPFFDHFVSLVERAYNMMQMAGYRITEQDSEHNNPVIAWMADARIALNRSAPPAPQSEGGES